MHATELVFPFPKDIARRPGRVVLPRRLCLKGHALPGWLAARLRRACAAAGVELLPTAGAAISLGLDRGLFFHLADAELRAQSYLLELNADGAAVVRSPGVDGLRHGVVTLCLLLEAAGAGATLSPLRISDSPAYRVRGVQADLAREFFPPMTYLKRLVDRLVDLKLNTLWLYLENHFRAPGLEDLSPRSGMTPDQAREISAYGAERGIDVVPGTNLLSHMEGWFRLERYSDLADGAGRSYPLLRRREAFELAARYADELAKAFPSRNFHAGLDEYLFVGANPAAARDIERHGKAQLFADFARRIVRRLHSRGKVVWYWDDMVIGKNVHRKEGFNEEWPKAFAAIPAKGTVGVHWYYWTDSDGKHGPILERVRAAGRPFVMAPSSGASAFEYGNLRFAAENQEYMARAGLKAQNGRANKNASCMRAPRAFGYVCTQWEAHYGNSFAAGWPLLAVSAEQAWSGGRTVDDRLLRALSFTLTGETSGALGRFLEAFSRLEDFLAEKQPRVGLRGHLVGGHPYRLWRHVSPVLSPEDRAQLRGLLAHATRARVQLGARDAELKESLRMPLVLFSESLRILDAFDSAWAAWHRAALLERKPGRRNEFNRRVAETLARIRDVIRSTEKIRRELKSLERTGHTPCDAEALARHVRALRGVIPLIRAAVRDGNGLPYFERLFYLPDTYQISSLKQFQFQNTFFTRWPGLPWPVRWKS